MESVLEDLKAIQLFVSCIKSRETSFKAQDAHCQLIDKPKVKAYLQSQYKLSELAHFFRKYESYFHVDCDGFVTLKNPELTVEELKSVYFFVDLLIKRQNRPIHVTNAINFVNTSLVGNFLFAHYVVENLNPFFKTHNDIFMVSLDQVSLMNYNGPVATSSVNKNVQEGKSSRQEKKYHKKMHKVALNFYIDLLKTREEISAKQAHSYLQDEVELRDFLREHYQLSNLKPFFKENSSTFSVVGEFVRLAPAPVANNWTHSTTLPVVNTSLYSTPAPFAKPSVSSTPVPFTQPRLPLAQPALIKYTSIPDTCQPVVTGAQNAKPMETKQQDASTLRNSGTPTSSGSSTAISSLTSEASKKVKNAQHSSVSGNSSGTNLLSLVMSYRPQIAETTTYPNVVNSASLQGKRQDAACQTLSTGPILSLSVMNELKHD